MQAPPSDWWRTWFGPSYRALYDDYLLERTPTEVDQLESLLEMRPPKRILDLPCGQGRHAIELARRGYEVVGVDLSASMLAVARERAAADGLPIRFALGDMREPVNSEPFDLVINLFTSIGYFADSEDDRKVAEAARSDLNRNGRFVVEVVNGDQVIRSFQEREWFTVGDAVVMERRSLDQEQRRMTVMRRVIRDGEEETNVHALRLYGPRELRAVLTEAGFGRVQLYGDWDLSPVTVDSPRVLAVAFFG